ncbi:hypothetical protein [Laceyella putida]|uniref:Uncharacterized protein n=1 Tax=Laceyella putida TaxID=110101 RepID=A0ABW2RGV3_9BACL
MPDTFSFSNQADRKYAIVKMDAIPSCTGEPNYHDEYYFVFETKLLEKTKLVSGEDIEPSIVNVDIVHHKCLPLFKKGVYQADKLLYQGGRMRVNAFIEIEEITSAYDTKYIAVLKDQLVQRGESKRITMQKVLLLQVNKGEQGQLDNCELVKYAAQFESAIAYQEGKRRINRYYETFFYLDHLLKEKGNEKDKEYIERVLEMVRSEKEHEEKRDLERLHRYEELRRSL